MEKLIRSLFKIEKAKKIETFLDFLLKKVPDLKWRSVGGRKNNTGTIDIGSDAVDILNERITNAIDAVMEKHAFGQMKKDLKINPRQAVEKWFDIPGGRVHRLSREKQIELAKLVQIEISKGQKKAHPTISIWDQGIGLHPDHFSSTIVSLNEDNKVDKFYLAGTYGQGGSTVFPFCDYSIIISRRCPSCLEKGKKDQIGWTIVRYNELLDEEHKNGTYEYLTDPRGRVFRCSLENWHGDDFSGTLIKHIGYHLDSSDSYHRIIKQNGMNFLNANMPDTILPFSVLDKRISPAKKTIIMGNETLLSDEKNTDVEYRGQYHKKLGYLGNLEIDYWVMAVSKDAKDKKKSNFLADQYVDPNGAIALSFFGQRYARFHRRFFKESVNLSFLQKYLIVHVVCDALSARGRRHFVANKAKIKEGVLKAKIENAICEALLSDAEIRHLEGKRKEMMVTESHKKTEEKIRDILAKQIDHYLNKAGHDLALLTPPDQIPQGEEEALLDEPTFLTFARKGKSIALYPNKKTTIQLRTNAKDNFLTRKKSPGKLDWGISGDSEILGAGHSGISKGRFRILAGASAKAEAGKIGKLWVELSSPAGTRLRAEINLLIRDKIKRETTKNKKKPKTAAPETQLIDKNHPYWIENQWTEDHVAEVLLGQENDMIYISIANRYLKEALKLKKSDRTINSFREKYAASLAFFAWLQQHEAGKEKEISDEYRLKELTRAARSIITSLQTSEELISS